MLKQKFDAAKILIKDKQYDEARTLLATIDHPTAKEWLAKIDQISPQSKSHTQSQPWYRIWINTFFQPSNDTFEEIAHSPKASAIRASIWVFATSLISSLSVIAVLGLLFTKNSTTSKPLPWSLIVIVCLVYGLLSAITFCINAASLKLFSNLFGGSGTYSQIAYTNGAVNAVVTILTGFGMVIIILFINIFSPIVLIFVVFAAYSLVSGIIALRAATQLGWLKAIVVFLISLLITDFLINGAGFALINSISIRFMVAGPSMQPNLHTDELLFVSRVNAIGGASKQGDLLVFNPPGQPPDEPPFIKRVIGLPGETVEMRNQNVYVNGVQLNEPYINEPCEVSRCPDRVWQLGPEDYFLMGDNRNHSSDSRSFGVVSKDRILGKALFVYWPPSDWGIIN